MAVVIRLDKQALIHLIDELGEEFKLELARGVLAETFKNIMRTFATKVAEREIMRAKKIMLEYATTAMAAEIGTIEKGGWNKRPKITVQPKIKSEIDSMVTSRAASVVARLDSVYSKKLAEIEERYLIALEADVKKWLDNVAWNRVQLMIEEEVSRRVRNQIAKV